MSAKAPLSVAAPSKGGIGAGKALCLATALAGPAVPHQCPVTQSCIDFWTPAIRIDHQRHSQRRDEIPSWDMLFGLRVKGPGLVLPTPLDLVQAAVWTHLLLCLSLIGPRLAYAAAEDSGRGADNVVLWLLRPSW